MKENTARNLYNWLTNIYDKDIFIISWIARELRYSKFFEYELITTWHDLDSTRKDYYKAKKR